MQYAAGWRRVPRHPYGPSSSGKSTLARALQAALPGAASQARWLAVLGGWPVLWVGVGCDLRVAEAREAARPDRTPGMARRQAATVHQGVRYDLRLDSSHDSPQALARRVAAVLAGGPAMTGGTLRP